MLIVGGALVAATAIAGAGTAHRRRWVRAAVLAAGGAVAASVAGLLSPSDRLTIAVTNAVLCLLVVATAGVMARTLVLRGTVDTHTVAGALATYLLLALLYSSAHQFLAAVQGGRYVDGIEYAGDASAYLYFSVITLTTVGFGDIVPASGAARAVAVAEALTGQLYLVSVVAAVVGNWRPRQPPERPTR